MFKNFSFLANNCIIKPCRMIKILGTYLRDDLSWETEVGKLAANLQNRIFNIKKLTNVTNFQTRLQFINGFVIGKMRYMLPLYNNATKIQLTKLHRVVMTAARCVIGSYCCRSSTLQILTKSKWLTLHNMIHHSSLKHIHKILTTCTPPSLHNMYNTHNTRISKDISPKYIPMCAQYKKFYIISCIKLYNQIPSKIKSKTQNYFKTQSKNWLISNVPGVSDTCD